MSNLTDAAARGRVECWRRPQDKETTMRGWAMVLVAGALTLAGCGGSGGGHSDYADGAALAKAAGCIGYVKDSEAPMFTQESGTCQIDGKDVYLAIYADNKSRDS